MIAADCAIFLAKQHATESSFVDYYLFSHCSGSISAGNIDVGIAGGVESMTHFEMTSALNPEKISQDVFEKEEARNCLLPMGTTSDVRNFE